MKRVLYRIGIWIVMMILSGCGNGADRLTSQIDSSTVEQSRQSDSGLPSASTPQHFSGSAKAKITDENKTTITLLVLYNDAAKEASHGDIEAKIYQHIAMTNTIYEESRVPIYLRVVKIEPYNIDNNMTSNKALSIIASDKKLLKERESYGADEVVLFRDFANDGYCGVAYQNNKLKSSLAYAHVTISCPTYVVAHELGHTMGLVHSQKERFKGRTTYARGFIKKDAFVTVMAYATGKAIKINKFSSPSLSCFEEQCGIEAGELGEADAARALRESMQRVASFYK